MQIQRRRVSRRWAPSRLTVMAAVAALAITGSGVAAAATSGFGTQQVGQDYGDGIVLPTNQTVRPAGQRYLEQHGKLISSTLNPDGTHVAASTHGRGVALTLFDAENGKVIQRAGTGDMNDLKLDSGTVSFDGPHYSADGTSLWFGQADHILRFPVNDDGTVGKPESIQLPRVSGTRALPAGMAESADGSKLYVALNGQNSLGVIDTSSNTLVDTVAVGNAPRQVELVNGHAFVSNEGGRPASSGDSTVESYGTDIVADPDTGVATTGTVSVVDLDSRTQTATIPVGLQPTALYRHGQDLFVANTNDDSVSIIDTASREVTQTFNVNPLPGVTVGYHPNAFAMPDGKHLLVSLGRANALAVYGYEGGKQPVSYQGLVPTDYYPTEVQLDEALGKVIVTNERGIGARGPVSTTDKGPGTDPATSHNTHNPTGSLTSFEMPSRAQLKTTTHRVFMNNHWDRKLAQGSMAHRDAKPRPVPEILGGPSPIKHVFLIDRENRTYDQVLGDVKKGNGDPSLTQFGKRATPNLHALSQRYTLYDNFYGSGTNSADGHNWLMQADSNDYIQSQFGQFVRSYVGKNDPLTGQRVGFLWDAAARAGKSAKIFGEYVGSSRIENRSELNWSDFYQTSRILEGKAQGDKPVPEGSYYAYSARPSQNKIIEHAYPKFNTGIPDQYRVDQWLKSFRKSEKTGKLANLNLMLLPQDHTSGLSADKPYPIAEVADNDLALGRVIEEITHSKFWKNSAIFVLEDDTQNGVDHVDGHRGPLTVISPYAKQGGVDSHYYTQINVIRTIEQILGISPMNQNDRAAEPMRAAFTTEPDFTPYTAKPNRIPLTYGLRGDGSGGRSTSSEDSVTSATVPAGVPASKRGLYRQWQQWSEHQRFDGRRAAPDRANPAQLNRLTWYLGHGWAEPFPGDNAVLAPDRVPGRFLPPTDTEG